MPGVSINDQFSLDIKRLEEKLNISRDKIFENFFSKEYFCYMTGFIAGMPFLGDIGEKIRLDRLETPRVKVPKGSVGVTEQFCNIYTFESPGGWNIIGNSPKKVFKKLAAGYIVEYGMMLTEGQDDFMTSGFIYTPRKVFRFGLWGLTRKTKLGKLSVCSVACIVASYEIYRLLFPTNTKIDAFLKGAGFTAEKFLTDSAVYKRLD